MIMASQCRHSFIWDSETYYLFSKTYTPTAITGSGKRSYVFVIANTTAPSGNLTLCSIWGASSGNRAFIVRVTSTGKVQYLQSSDGTATDVDVITVGSMSAQMQSVIVTVDPTLSGASNVVKIYFDGTLQSLTTTTDTGNYTTNSSSTNKLTLGCFFDGSNVPSQYYEGVMNQFVITSDIISQSEVTAFYNSGSYLMAHNYFDNISIGANFDSSYFSAGYVVPDVLGTNFFYQVSSSTASIRTSHLCRNLNTSGIDGWAFTDSFNNMSNFFGFFGAPGASVSFGGSCVFTINHTSVSDPDRNSNEILSCTAFDVNVSDIWVGVTYTWGAAESLPHSHGGFSIIDCRNDDTSAVWTHRSLVNSNETYRVLIGIDGIQSDFESTVPKNKQVWCKLSKNGSNADVGFYWNNNGVMTQIWSTQSLTGVRFVRIKFHSRDEDAYDNPDSFTFSNLVVTRTTPVL